MRKFIKNMRHWWPELKLWWRVKRTPLQIIDTEEYYSDYDLEILTLWGAHAIVVHEYKLMGAIIRTEEMVKVNHPQLLRDKTMAADFLIKHYQKFQFVVKSVTFPQKDGSMLYFPVGLPAVH